MSTPDDFTLLIGDGWAESGSAFELRGFIFEATSVWRCCPSDGIMRDVTEDEAHEWFEHMPDPWHPVPPMFEPFIESDIQKAKERLEDPQGLASKADDDLKLEREYRK